ncbi:MAG: ligase-associated DNA damage response DEXH box helicase [Bacteroidota bacterium]
MSIPESQSFFQFKNYTPYPFQEETWDYYHQGYHGLLNAPTGSGKTLSLLLPVIEEYLKNYPEKTRISSIQMIWISPIRALTKEIEQVANQIINFYEIPWKVAVRTGDTTVAERQKMKNNLPQILITTPESLHLLLASKGYYKTFGNLKCLVADEWHELMGSKRAVLLELALSRLKTICPDLRIWGISATIGNMNEAAQVLFGPGLEELKFRMVKANIEKKIEVVSIIPDEIEKFPWHGHLGIKLLGRIIPIIEKSSTSLIFTNVRSQAEIWYQRLLEAAPELAGVLAMHHGSIDKKLRMWVEAALHSEQLKAVVCTSSLDLGVDFRPVETIVQIGSPRGVSRFIQRAGRSGHRPGATSRIYFLPTHSLELVEVAALKNAIKEKQLEDRKPYFRSFDVLIQYLVTLAVSEGFDPRVILEEVRSTFSYESISDEEWQWVLNFIRYGGESLDAYDEFKKVEVEDGLWKVKNRGIAMRHRLSIGTIVSDTMLRVKFMRGGFIGTVEEWFISKMKIGDKFWFAGKPLEFVKLDKLTVYVKKVKISGKAMIPSWQGGRMNLSSQLAKSIRIKLEEAVYGQSKDEEIQVLAPLFEKQQEESIVPKENELLIEKTYSKDGCHVFVYPFEGRFVHEGLSHLLAYRISMLQPISFSIAFTDYGFELLSDQDIPIEDAVDTDIFSANQLYEDINASVNSNEMARRKFRDIANIAGLVFQGFPGKEMSNRHLQSNSALFFDVFSEYDPDNLLLRQAFEEVFEFQLEEDRVRKVLERIESQTIRIMYPKKFTPFSFPILTDRFRERYFGEALEEQIMKMKVQMEN